MNVSFLRKLLPAILLTICVTPALHAQLSENFDALTPGPAVTSAGAFQTINGTNVDVVGGLNGSFFNYLCVSPASGNCIDLGGSEGNPLGQLQSVQTFGPGTYDLSFDLLGSDRSQETSTTVTFGDYSQTFDLSPYDTTSGVVVNQLVTLTSPGQLLFVNNGNIDPAPYNDEGAILDNVTVSAVTTGATPEPGSLVLLGTGALGMVGALRRKMFRAS